MSSEIPLLMKGSGVEVSSYVFSGVEVSVGECAEWVEVLLSILTATVIMLTEEGCPFRKCKMSR